jgi:hypothetical protein
MYYTKDAIKEYLLKYIIEQPDILDTESEGEKNKYDSLENIIEDEIKHKFNREQILNILNRNNILHDKKKFTRFKRYINKMVKK